MDKRMRLWLLLVGSLAFTTWSLWSQRSSAPARPTVQAGAPEANSAPAAAPPPAATVAATPSIPLTDEQWKGWRAALGTIDRDPFYTTAELLAMNRQPDAPAPELPPPPPAPASYTVKLVLMKGSEGSALIDDRVVHVGDTLGDERVVQITPDGVVLAKGTSRRRLPVASASAPVIALERTR